MGYEFHRTYFRFTYVFFFLLLLLPFISNHFEDARRNTFFFRKINFELLGNPIRNKSSSLFQTKSSMFHFLRSRVSGGRKRRRKKKFFSNVIDAGCWKRVEKVVGKGNDRFLSKGIPIDFPLYPSFSPENTVLQPWKTAAYFPPRPILRLVTS